MIYFYAIVVFALGFTTLYCMSMAKQTWFKMGISIIFSALVSMLVTFNLWR